ncbi:482_t:CDS:2, partial [Racocetra persica]
MGRMNKFCNCIPMRTGVIIIAILCLAVGIICGIPFILNLHLRINDSHYILQPLDYIALVIISLMILVSCFGLIIVCCAESARLLKVYSWLFFFIVFLTYVCAVYMTIVIASSSYLKHSWPYIIVIFICVFIGTYFAKVISDYASSVNAKQNNAQTPGRMEDSNVTNSQ